MQYYSCTIGYIFNVIEKIQFLSFITVVATVVFTFIILVDGNSISAFKEKYNDKDYPLKKIIFIGLIALFILIFSP